MKESLPYRNLRFPETPKHRPYVIIDMVATIDGKIVSGERGEDVSDLGSPIDHAVMRLLEDSVDAVLIGAGTLRATPSGWDPKTRFRIVVSKSGNVDVGHSFLKGRGGFVALPEGVALAPFHGVRALVSGVGDVEPARLATLLREKGCERLLILGGSRTNGAFLRAQIVDEVFLTIAPKIKLGEGLPTIAEGEALPRASLLEFELVEHHAVGSELFLRYRRRAKR
ncbi:MAG: RibD family protein [Fimbriimonadaceae bacterium]